MDRSFYEQMFRSEETYWWSTSRRELVHYFLNVHFPSYAKDTVTLVDIGCSTGVLVHELEKIEDTITIGIDSSLYPLSFAQKRGLVRLINCDLANLCLRNSSCDVILLLDVIEHMEDDLRALKQLYRVLKEKGLVIMTAPAFECLWSHRDVFYGHRKRYRVDDLREMGLRAGFCILKSSYIHMFYFPLVWVVVRIKALFRMKVNIEEYSAPAWISRVFILILRFEKLLLRYINLPFGVSTITVLRKGGSVDS